MGFMPPANHMRDARICLMLMYIIKADARMDKILVTELLHRFDPPRP